MKRTHIRVACLMAGVGLLIGCNGESAEVAPNESAFSSAEPLTVKYACNIQSSGSLPDFSDGFTTSPSKLTINYTYVKNSTTGDPQTITYDVPEFPATRGVLTLSLKAESDTLDPDNPSIMLRPAMSVRKDGVVQEAGIPHLALDPQVSPRAPHAAVTLVTDGYHLLLSCGQVLP